MQTSSYQLEYLNAPYDQATKIMDSEASRCELYQPYRVYVKALFQNQGSKECNDASWNYIVDINHLRLGGFYTAKEATNAMIQAETAMLLEMPLVGLSVGAGAAVTGAVVAAVGAAVVGEEVSIVVGARVPI